MQKTFLEGNDTISKHGVFFMSLRNRYLSSGCLISLYFYFIIIEQSYFILMYALKYDLIKAEY